VHEHEAEKIAGDVEGGPVVKGSGKFHSTTLNAEIAEPAEYMASQRVLRVLR
jgi:hypothetical protein